MADSGQPPTPAGVDRLCAETFLTTHAHDQEDNLLFVRDRLLRSEVDLTELLALYARVVSGKRVPDNLADPLFNVLRLSGVVKTEGGTLRVRNRIYERVFDRAWISRSLPGAEVRRQKAAFRRGQRRASLVAAALIAVIGSLAIGAWQQAKRAERGERAALRATSWPRQVRPKRTSMRATQAGLAQQQEGMAATMKAARDLARHERNAAVVSGQRADESARREREASRHALASAQSEKQQRRIADAETKIAEAQTLDARRHAYIAGIPWPGIS